MILVDTSVLIDLIKGADNGKVKLLEEAIKQNLPFGIASYTYQEVLQGAKDEDEYNQLNMYLSTQKIYYLPEKLDVYNKAARMFYSLRRKGATVRSMIDVLIATVAMEYDLYLLHNDRDFDMIAKELPKLKIYV